VAEAAHEHLPRVVKLIEVEVAPRAFPVLPRHVRPQPPTNVGWCQRQVLFLDQETGYPPALYSLRNRAGLTPVVPAPHVQAARDEGNRMRPGDAQPEIIIIRDRDRLVEAARAFEALPSHHHARRAGDLVVEE